MSKNQISRRSFLQGCSAAIAAMAGARVTNLVFSPQAQTTGDEQVLIVLFLRGGWDALNVVPPIAGSDRGLYVSARPELQIPTSGEGSTLALDQQFGLHPALGPLYDVYQAGKLAVVHAVGLTADTRSHFDAMQYIELGTPDDKTTGQGWLTRHLESSGGVPGSVLLPAVSTGTSTAASLLGSIDAVSMTSPDQFTFYGYWATEEAQRSALRSIYDGDTWLYQAGLETLDAVDLMEYLDPGDYTPANGAVYPSGSFGSQLQTLAQLIKMDIGMRVATIDLGGWDTHESQGDGSGGYMASLLGSLGSGLAALYTDLDGAGSANYTARLNVVVQSEFGRRLKENRSGGTDHGHGSVMLLMGGGVNGGRVYANWPGLGAGQLYDGNDLDVTTDYRQVISEVLLRRFDNPNIEAVFPGYSGYAPMDIVQWSGASSPAPGKLVLNMLVKNTGAAP